MRPLGDKLDEEDRATVDKINEDFVENMSEPLSNILARNPLNKNYGRPVVDSYDWLGIIIAAWGYRRDLRELRDLHKTAVREQKAAGSPATQGNASNAPTDQETQTPVLVAVPPGAAIN